MNLYAISLFLSTLAAAQQQSSKPPVVALTTYRSANCSGNYVTTPSSVLVSPPLGGCVDLPPQTNSLSLRVMNGNITAGCELYIYEAPDCAASAMKVYTIHSGETKCEANPIGNGGQARSSRVLCG
ncbi:Ecp4 [Penicillium tannophilum]|nr:Ecp4 [Penicillium tannophilum]